MSDPSKLPTPYRCTCPHCNAQLKHNGTCTGRTVKCPGCNEPFRIPDVEELSRGQPESNGTTNPDDGRTDLRDLTTTGIERTTSGKPSGPRSPDPDAEKSRTAKLRVALDRGYELHERLIELSRRTDARTSWLHRWSSARAEDEATALEREASTLHDFVGKEITFNIANLPVSDLLRNAVTALSEWTFSLSAITGCMRNTQRAMRVGASPYELGSNEREYNCIRSHLDEAGIKLQSAAHALLTSSDCTDAPSVTVDEEMRAKEVLNITEGSDALAKYGIDAQIPYACVNGGSYEEVAEALRVPERFVVEQMDRLVVFRVILAAWTISRSMVKGKTVSEGAEAIKKTDVPELDEEGKERAKMWEVRGYLPQVARRLAQVAIAAEDYLAGKYHM